LRNYGDSLPNALNNNLHTDFAKLQQPISGRLPVIRTPPHQSKSILIISYDLPPPGVFTSTLSPTDLPMRETRRRRAGPAARRPDAACYSVCAFSGPGFGPDPGLPNRYPSTSRNPDARLTSFAICQYSWKLMISGFDESMGSSTP